VDGQSVAAIFEVVWIHNEMPSAGTIALEISSRKARVQALQKRWDYLRANLDLILIQRGADMADLPGGASGILRRDYKGRRADQLVTRIDLGVVSLVAELRGHERQAAEELGQWKTHVEEPVVEPGSSGAISGNIGSHVMAKDGRDLFPNAP
jgi:hypothetical protein